MALTVADHMLMRLRAWDVEDVFAYPGDGINGLISSFGRVDDPPRLIQSRHEEMSALGAVGYAKLGRRLGVCLATSGPGAVHLLNGLYDAKLDHTPVVAIVGQTARSAIGSSYQQEIDLQSLLKGVAHHYVAQVTVPEQLPQVLDRAIRVALTERAPTAVIVPNDVQELEHETPPHAPSVMPSSIGVEWPQVVPDDPTLQRAAEILCAGDRPAILIGQGAKNAAAEVQEVADILGAGVAKALLGKDVVPDTVPYVTGSIGLLGTRPSYELMTECDTLLTVGSSFPYAEFLPEPGQARGVQIDLDGTFIGMRYPYELSIVGDARATLRALIPHLRRAQDRSWQEKIIRSVENWWDAMGRVADVPADPVNPQLAFRVASDHLPDDVIVTADSGSAANWYARQLRFREGMRGTLSGTLATMGSAVPYAIGAKFAQPTRPAVAFSGDGAMQMNGLAELITIRRYWQEWDDPRLVVAVLHNNDLNQVTWELRAMGGSPKIAASQDLPDVDYAAFAEQLGLGAITVTDPDQLEQAWRSALSADRPTVLDLHVNADVPPVPPHATVDQIRSMAESLLRGDDDWRGILEKGLRTKAAEVLPGR